RPDFSDMARMGRVSFDFRAKLSYYHAKNIRFFAVIRPPDHSRLLCMCNGLALVIHQGLGTPGGRGRDVPESMLDGCTFPVSSPVPLSNPCESTASTTVPEVS